MPHYRDSGSTETATMTQDFGGYLPIGPLAAQLGLGIPIGPHAALALIETLNPSN